MIAVGGSQEAIHARPGHNLIILKDRKGFIKIAIQTGASLVPVFSFGENDIYDQPLSEPGSKLHKFRNVFKRLTGITPPIVNGRGFLQYSFGLIPRRRAITTVIGAPIDVTLNHSPTDKEVNDLHLRFVHELEQLFNHHVRQFARNPKIKLTVK